MDFARRPSEVAEVYARSFSFFSSRLERDQASALRRAKRLQLDWGTCLMFRRAHGADLNRELALLNDTVGGFFYHLLQQHPQMRVLPIISRRDVFHPIGVGGELVAFFETNTRRIIGIINRNGLSAVFLHYGEARHVSRPVTDINHIGEWNRPNLRVHV